MKPKIRNIYAGIVEAFRALTARLQAIGTEQTPPGLTDAQVAAIRSGKRAEAIAAYRQTALRYLDDVEGVHLPAMRADESQAAEAVRAAIERGIAPGSKARKPGLFALAQGSEETRALGTVAEYVIDGLEKLSRQQAESNAMYRSRRATTEALQERVFGYVRAAKGGDFDWAGYSTDRGALQLELTARAAAGDARAQMALERVPEIEKALLDRFGAAGLDTFQRNLGDVRSAVSDLMRAGTENLGQLESLIGGFERGLARTEAK